MTRCLTSVPKLVSVALSVFSNVETYSTSELIPFWYKDNTLIYTVVWHQTRCLWENGRYTDPWLAYPDTWEVGHIDINYTTGHSATDTKTLSDYYTKKPSLRKVGGLWSWGRKFSRGLAEPKIVPYTVFKEEGTK